MELYMIITFIFYVVLYLILAFGKNDVFNPRSQLCIWHNHLSKHFPDIEGTKGWGIWLRNEADGSNFTSYIF